MGKMRHSKKTAGPLVREVVYTPPHFLESAAARAEKKRCSTKARQAMNDKSSWRKLMMILAANFTPSDLCVTLTYDDEHLPKTRVEARARLKQFFAALRKHRSATGEKVLYVYAIETAHGDGRYHHHLVINGTGADYADIRRLWRYGSNVDFDTIDGWGGYKALAQYMTKEARELGRIRVGERSFVCSRGLAKPVRESEWVPADYKLEPPADAFVLEREERVTEFGRFSYIEYLTKIPSRKKKE